VYAEESVTGAVFRPELIRLMHSILEEATAEIPEAKRTSAIKADMAVAILARAARGERNPTALKMSAISAVARHSHYSRDISETRQAV
jgi:hypothetical protein